MKLNLLTDVKRKAAEEFCFELGEMLNKLPSTCEIDLKLYWK